jgi:hypothetical protein
VEDLTKFLQGLIPERFKPFISGLVAAVAVLVALIKLLDPLTSMWHGRKRSVAVQERLDRAIKATTFWEAWFKAHELVNSPEEIEQARAKVRRELQEIIAAFEVPPPLPKAHWRFVPGRSFLRRILLFYRPPDVAAWFFHLGFYFFLMLLLFYFIGAAIDPTTQEVSLSYAGSHLTEVLAPSLVVIIPLILLHLGADWRERAKRRLTTSPTSSFDPIRSS